MELKPQDVVVAAKLLTYEDSRPVIATMAVELELSQSHVHRSLKRLESARLIHSNKLRNAPIRRAIREFFLHGVKYSFPAKRGQITRGLATGYAAPPLRDLIAASPDDPPPVWPSAEGSDRGISFAPLYDNVPIAALRDGRLYEILALLDALRDGRARERKLAEHELIRRIDSPS